jgi:2-keto-4-pentenoate hydratase/2-oxohepta-3-ene-1,7-dioic acid hydratase in catechol pathway
VKLVSFERNGHAGLGEWRGDGTIRPYRIGVEMAAVGVMAAVAADFDGRPLTPSGETIDAADVKLRAPMPRPRRNIFCVGKNYREHAKEFAGSGFDTSTAPGTDVPDAPILFSKVPDCVIGPGDTIEIDSAVSAAVDYEAELCVIIGRRGRGIGKQDALSHVWGYTIVNDVTARDIQARHKQWLLGKSQDSFCPMGPVAVTADEIDLDNVPIFCWVNGEKRQDANTRDLLFDVPTLIETISAGVTLHPGDLIATGTPAGVGIGFKPPRYLKDGDSVRIEIGDIGILENPVVDRAARSAIHAVS